MAHVTKYMRYKVVRCGFLPNCTELKSKGSEMCQTCYKIVSRKRDALRQQRKIK